MRIVCITVFPTHRDICIAVYIEMYMSRHFRLCIKGPGYASMYYKGLSIHIYLASPISAPPVPSSASCFAASRPHSWHESRCVVADARLRRQPCASRIGQGSSPGRDRIPISHTVVLVLQAPRQKTQQSETYSDARNSSTPGKAEGHHSSPCQVGQVLHGKECCREGATGAEKNAVRRRVA